MPRKLTGMLAKCHPQNTIIKRLLNALRVTDCLRQRRLTIASCSSQGRCNSNRFLAVFVKQFADQFFKLMRALDKIQRQVFYHERHACYLAVLVQITDELRPFMLEVEAVHITNP